MRLNWQLARHEGFRIGGSKPPSIPLQPPLHPAGGHEKLNTKRGDSVIAFALQR
jgi:hypothetical protein